MPVKRRDRDSGRLRCMWISGTDDGARSSAGGRVADTPVDHLSDVDVINTPRVSAGRFACFRVISRTPSQKMATNDNVADSVKLAVIRDALDRAGLAAKNAVEAEVGPPKPYETMLDSIEAGSRAEYRRSIGRPDDYGPCMAARPWKGARGIG